MNRALVVACSVALAGVCSAQEAPVEVKVGKQAPDFTATGIDGKEFKLSQKLASGKHVVLMFSRAHW